MSKIAVVYWSGTGNTETMAGNIVSGAIEAGAEVKLFEADSFNASMMDDYSAIAFGCPSMGDEVLEESTFEPMFEDCKAKLDGKRIALFGSYGWGDGEWMRNWEADCRNCGAELVCDCLICNYEPDSEAIQQCVDMGKALV